MQNPSPEHQGLVQALIYHFKNKLGYDIVGADYPGYDAPGTHGRHRPDILAKDRTGLIHIAEAKLGDDIANPDSKEQFVDFSNRVMSNDSGTVARMAVPFHIVVYKKDEPKLKAVLNQLGLGAKVGNTIQIWTL